MLQSLSSQKRLFVDLTNGRAQEKKRKTASYLTPLEAATTTFRRAESSSSNTKRSNNNNNKRIKVAPFQSPSMRTFLDFAFHGLEHRQGFWGKQVVPFMDYVTLTLFGRTCRNAATLIYHLNQLHAIESTRGGHPDFLSDYKQDREAWSYTRPYYVIMDIIDELRERQEGVGEAEEKEDLVLLSPSQDDVELLKYLWPGVKEVECWTRDLLSQARSLQDKSLYVWMMHNQKHTGCLEIFTFETLL
jgi:hypothetical protein